MLARRKNNPICSLSKVVNQTVRELQKIEKPWLCAPFQQLSKSRAFHLTFGSFFSKSDCKRAAKNRNEPWLCAPFQQLSKSRAFHLKNLTFGSFFLVNIYILSSHHHTYIHYIITDRSRKCVKQWSKERGFRNVTIWKKQQRVALVSFTHTVHYKKGATVAQKHH